MKQGSAAVDTPQVTGGDAGHVDGLSTDGNQSKGEDSHEITNAKPGVNVEGNGNLHAAGKLNSDPNADDSIKEEAGVEKPAADLNQVAEASPDQLDVMARTGSTVAPHAGMTSVPIRRIFAGSYHRRGPFFGIYHRDYDTPYAKV